MDLPAVLFVHWLASALFVFTSINQELKTSCHGEFCGHYLEVVASQLKYIYRKMLRPAHSSHIFISASSTVIEVLLN